MRQTYFLFVLICVSARWTTATDITMEAENAELTNVTVQTKIKPFSGTGYVTDFDSANDKIKFNVEIPDINAASQLYALKIQYNSPFGEKGFDLIINDNPTSGILKGNGNQFSSHSAGNFLLKKGSNSVVIGNGWGHFSIDFIVLMPKQQVSFNIRKTPINPKATAETKKLYTALLRQFGKKVLSGQQLDKKEIEYIQQQSGGKEPVVAGYDFMNTNHFGNASEQAAYMQQAIDGSKKKGGLVTFSWHWRDLSGTPKKSFPPGFYVVADNVHVDLTKLSDKNSREYKTIIRDIDHVAKYLKQAQSAKVPILFRPLHEAQGQWFWWG
jgi:mannan endo-1,4-beta-mannosidase